MRNRLFNESESNAWSLLLNRGSAVNCIKFFLIFTFYGYSQLTFPISYEDIASFYPILLTSICKRAPLCFLFLYSGSSESVLFEATLTKLSNIRLVPWKTCSTLLSYMPMEADSSSDANFQKRMFCPSPNYGSATLTGISKAFPGFIFYFKDDIPLFSLILKSAVCVFLHQEWF